MDLAVAGGAGALAPHGRSSGPVAGRWLFCPRSRRRRFDDPLRRGGTARRRLAAAAHGTAIAAGRRGGAGGRARSRRRQPVSGGRSGVGIRPAPGRIGQPRDPDRPGVAQADFQLPAGVVPRCAGGRRLGGLGHGRIVDAGRLQRFRRNPAPGARKGSTARGRRAVGDCDGPDHGDRGDAGGPGPAEGDGGAAGIGRTDQTGRAPDPSTGGIAAQCRNGAGAPGDPGRQGRSAAGDGSLDPGAARRHVVAGIERPGLEGVDVGLDAGCGRLDAAVEYASRTARRQGADARDPSAGHEQGQFQHRVHDGGCAPAPGAARWIASGLAKSCRLRIRSGDARECGESGHIRGGSDVRLAIVRAGNSRCASAASNGTIARLRLRPAPQSATQSGATFGGPTIGAPSRPAKAP